MDVMMFQVGGVAKSSETALVNGAKLFTEFEESAAAFSKLSQEVATGTKAMSKALPEIQKIGLAIRDCGRNTYTLGTKLKDKSFFITNIVGVNKDYYFGGRIVNHGRAVEALGNDILNSANTITGAAKTTATSTNVFTPLAAEANGLATKSASLNKSIIRTITIPTTGRHIYETKGIRMVDEAKRPWYAVSSTVKGAASVVNKTKPVKSLFTGLGQVRQQKMNIAIDNLMKANGKSQKDVLNVVNTVLGAHPDTKPIAVDFTKAVKKTLSSKQITDELDKALTASLAGSDVDSKLVVKSLMTGFNRARINKIVEPIKLAKAAAPDVEKVSSFLTPWEMKKVYVGVSNVLNKTKDPNAVKAVFTTVLGGNPETKPIADNVIRAITDAKKTKDIPAAVEQTLKSSILDSDADPRIIFGVQNELNRVCFGKVKLPPILRLTTNAKIAWKAEDIPNVGSKTTLGKFYDRTQNNLIKGMKNNAKDFPLEESRETGAMFTNPQVGNYAQRGSYLVHFPNDYIWSGLNVGGVGTLWLAKYGIAAPLYMAGQTAKFYAIGSWNRYLKLLPLKYGYNQFLLYEDNKNKAKTAPGKKSEKTKAPFVSAGGAAPDSLSFKQFKVRKVEAKAPAPMPLSSFVKLSGDTAADVRSAIAAYNNHHPEAKILITADNISSVVSDFSMEKDTSATIDSVTRSPFTFAISGDSLFIIKGGAENISKAVNKALAKAVPSQKSEITNPDTEQSRTGGVGGLQRKTSQLSQNEVSYALSAPIHGPNSKPVKLPIYSGFSGTTPTGVYGTVSGTIINVPKGALASGTYTVNYGKVSAAFTVQ